MIRKSIVLGLGALLLLSLAACAGPGWGPGYGHGWGPGRGSGWSMNRGYAPGYGACGAFEQNRFSLR